VEAFAFFGGVPRSILYDNTKLAVARILGDGTRTRSQMFSALQSHYLFEDKFGRPGPKSQSGAMTKAMSKGWSASCDDALWYRCLWPRILPG
jgi:transposase